MGKESRCYNPEGQRARGPEGQRARGPEGQRARGPEGQRARGPEGQAGVVMTWVVSLVGCGGPAGSQCGHETRRHRVLAALFSSVFASVLLAACGGGAGNDSVSTNYEPEPGSVGTGSLVATGSGDGEEEDNQQQDQDQQESESQQKESQQQQEQNQQNDPPASTQTGSNGEANNQENQQQDQDQQESEGGQQQQLTIIEEEDFPHVPPEEEAPRYSAQTISVSFPDRHTDANYRTETYEVVGNIGGFSYWLEDAPNTGTSGSWENRTLDVSLLSRNGSLDPFSVRNPNTGEGLTRRQFVGWPQSAYAGLYNTLLEYYENLDSDGNFLSRILDEQSKSWRKARYERITASYNKENGFVGAYIYKGEVGSFQSDVNLRFDYRPYQFAPTPNDQDLIQNPRIIGTIGNDLVMGGDKFHGFIIDTEFNVKDGTFEVKPQFGYAFGPRKE